MSICPMPREIVHIATPKYQDIYVDLPDYHNKHLVITLTDGPGSPDGLRYLYLANYELKSWTDFEITIVGGADQNLIFDPSAWQVYFRHEWLEGVLLLFTGLAVNSVALRSFDAGNHEGLLVTGTVQPMYHPV